MYLGNWSHPLNLRRNTCPRFSLAPPPPVGGGPISGCQFFPWESGLPGQSRCPSGSFQEAWGSGEGSWCASHGDEPGSLLASCQLGQAGESMVFSSGHNTRNPSGTVSSKSLFSTPAWPLPGTRRGCIGFRPVPRARQLTHTHHGWLESLDEYRGFPSLGPSIAGVCGVCQGALPGDISPWAWPVLVVPELRCCESLSRP